MKISLTKKEQIKADHLTGEYSYGDLSLKYLVSRTKVYYICNPDKELDHVSKLPKKGREANIKDCAKYRHKKQAESINSITAFGVG